jgi:hypothetical protein
LNIRHTFQRTFFAACLAACCAIGTRCGQAGRSSGGDEGVIEFRTRALDEAHPLYGFAPDAATLKFKDDRFLLEMNTMGMFNMAIIGNTSEKKMAQTIRFMNIRQACLQDSNDLHEENRDYQLIIEETGEVKEILGLKSYRLRVRKTSEPDLEFDAWYTKDLGFENANSLTPYFSVPGVLLDYRIKKWGMEMHFVAKSYKKIAVPDEVFEIPPTMKIVSKAEMEGFFKDLQ